MIMVEFRPQKIGTTSVGHTDAASNVCSASFRRELSCPRRKLASEKIHLKPTTMHR